MPRSKIVFPRDTCLPLLSCSNQCNRQQWWPVSWLLSSFISNSHDRDLSMIVITCRAGLACELLTNLSPCILQENKAGKAYWDSYHWIALRCQPNSASCVFSSKGLVIWGANDHTSCLWVTSRVHLWLIRCLGALCNWRISDQVLQASEIWQLIRNSLPCKKWDLFTRMIISHLGHFVNSHIIQCYTFKALYTLMFCAFSCLKSVLFKLQVFNTI